MQKILFSLTLVLLSMTVRAQESVTLSGGYVVARGIDYSSQHSTDYTGEATGFRITGTYEVGPIEPKKFIHGITSSYIFTTTSVDYLNKETELGIRTLPFCYAPKFMIGSEKAMAFAKAEVGIQFTRIKAGGEIDESDNDFGIVMGIGFGGMLYVSKTVFLNLEYQLAFMTNSYYANGYLNSVQVGIGFDLGE